MDTSYNSYEAFKRLIADPTAENVGRSLNILRGNEVLYEGNQLNFFKMGANGMYSQTGPVDRSQ